MHIQELTSAVLQRAFLRVVDAIWTAGRPTRSGHPSLALYDALVSINVPSDKARAVVDAMERDMGTTLATKQDLDVVRLATKQDLEIVRRDMESGFESVKRATENRFALVDQRFDALESSFDHKIVSARDQLQLKIDGQELRIVVKLGSMLFLGFGLIIAVLKLWV